MRSIDQWIDRRSPRTTLVWVLALLVVSVQPQVPAFAQASPFSDTAGSVHEVDIALLAQWGITSGCDDNLYCPEDLVTRGQMAAFMRRSFSTPTSQYDYFTDDSNSVFQADINSITGVGITTGCNPPTGSLYCTDDPLTRGQMAAFLRRTLSLPAGPDAFSDDRNSVFQDDINALAAAGIAKGCSESQFCPDDHITRAQMASFLVRALDHLECRGA
jgi:hypothetical protein